MRKPWPRPLWCGRGNSYDCVLAVLNRGLSDETIAIARDAGAGDATIIHGRGSGGHDMKFLSFEMLKKGKGDRCLADR